ncbi:MAG: hypothetical protein AB1941_04040 [Gemmatimonadota bacterium]
MARMEALLESSGSVAHPTDARVVQAFLKQIGKTKEELLEIVPVLGSIEAELDDHAYGAFLKFVSASLHNIVYMHQHLSFVNTRWTPQETDVFLKAVFAPLEATSGIRRPLSVVPSNSYMFEETDLSSYLLQRDTNPGDGATPTLFLPKLEASNPLQWGTLVHEMGHAFSEPIRTFLKSRDVEKDILVIVGQRPQNVGVVLRWAEEIFCDLLAVRLLGPAYLASFVDFIVVLAASEGILSPSYTHPFPQWRVGIISDHLKEANVSRLVRLTRSQRQWPDLVRFFIELFEERSWAERRYLGGTGERAVIDVRELDDRIIRHLPELLPQGDLTAIKETKLPLLRDRLLRRIPIATVSIFEETKNKPAALQRLRALQESLRSADGQDVEAELAYLQEGVRERPCSVAEIVLAGWLHKVEDLYFPAIMELEAFTRKQGEEFAGQVLQLDGLLRTSIESAYLATILSPDPEGGRG